MKKDLKKQIPEFKSQEEEAEFWDKNSFTDYWDQGKPVSLKASFSLSQRLELRIDQETAEKLEEEASKKGLGPSTLARMWIKERLSNL